ncbi:hypothetical protein RSAG8_11260, partial [Rhizoctonia solani AG-8 WAC10335]
MAGKGQSGRYAARTMSQAISILIFVKEARIVDMQEFGRRCSQAAIMLRSDVQNDV